MAQLRTSLSHRFEELVCCGYVAAAVGGGGGRYKLRQQVGRWLENETVQRAAKRYDDDGHGKDIGSRLLLLAAAIMAARALPPQINKRRMANVARGENTRSSASCRVGWIRSSMELSAY